MTFSAEQPIDARTLARWRNAVIVMFMLGGLALASWGSRLPSIRADLSASDGVIGVIVACTTIGSIAGIACSTPILARLGPRVALRSMFWLIALGVAVIGIGSGLLHAIPLTAVGFVVAGFGLGAADMVMNVEGSAVETRRGRTLMPFLHGAWSAGAALGSGLGAACAALRIAVEWQLLGVTALVVIAVTIAVQYIPAHDPAVKAAGEPHERPSRADRLRAWLSGWTDVRLLLIGLVMLGVELGEGSSNNWLTLSVSDNHGQTDAIAALFFTLFAVTEMLTRFLAGPIVDRIGRVAAVRATAAIGVVGLALFVLGGPVWVILLGTLFWAVGVSMGFPLGMSAAADSGPNPGARVSVVGSIGYLANLAGPPVVGFLAQSVGLLNALWLVALLLAASFAAAGALRPVTWAGKPPIAQSEARD